MKTFICNFGNGVTCKIQTTDTATPGGASHILKTEWINMPQKITKRTRDRYIKKYISWINSVNQILANEWNTKIMYLIQKSKYEYEAWEYTPNKPPKNITQNILENTK